MGASTITKNAGKGARDNRVKDRKRYRDNLAAIDMNKRATPPREPVRVKDGRKTYSYGIF